MFSQKGILTVFLSLIGPSWRLNERMYLKAQPLSRRYWIVCGCLVNKFISVHLWGRLVLSPCSPDPAVTCLPEPFEAQNVLHLQHATCVLLYVGLPVWSAFIFTPRCHESQGFPVLNLLCCLKDKKAMTIRLFVCLFSWNYNTFMWTIFLSKLW